MVKRIQIERHGGPEVMALRETEPAAPTADQVLIRNNAIGVNFIDTYHRSGLYPLSLPSGIGLEGAGEILEIGENVSRTFPELTVGSRVGYCSGPAGAYGETHCIPADRAIPLPDDASDATAAACLLKGLTAHYLIRRIYKVSSADTVLFHAAAGGVGRIACQWLHALGATVIGTVGSAEKAEIAKAAGCDHIIRYDHEDISARVIEITDGAKLPVVFDGVGASTWEASLDCLAPLGLMVSFGNASGPVTNVNLGILAAKGSLFVTRPTLFDYTKKRKDLLEAAQDLFAVIAAGDVKVHIDREYPLEDAEQAHRDLEGRKTSGSVLLRP